MIKKSYADLYLLFFKVHQKCSKNVPFPPLICILPSKNSLMLESVLSEFNMGHQRVHVLVQTVSRRLENILVCSVQTLLNFPQQPHWSRYLMFSPQVCEVLASAYAGIKCTMM